jgi:ABC-type transport system substrate-binding protein
MSAYRAARLCHGSDTGGLIGGRVNKRSRLVRLGLALLALAALTSCTPSEPTPAPPAPANVITCTASDGGTITNCGSGNGNVTNPTASPSPSATDLLCTDTHVFVSSFGWSGPPTATRPQNQAQPYPLCTGCTSLLTATLKGKTGDLALVVSSGKGRPKWTVEPVGPFDIDNSTEATNNADGYNLLVTPRAGAGATGTVHVVLNALCIGEAPSADFKFLVVP